MAFDGTKIERQKCCIACGRSGCKHLACLERPRFFAGQLLTEAELNSLDGYVRAKNRMHNRLLHGYGTVCGLEVTCHECDGWVRIHPGYALDPCGEDLVVCDPHDFDLMAAIRACRDSLRRKWSDCQPARLGSDCKGAEEHWCIAIRYEERETRPVTPLKRPRGSCCGKCATTGPCRCGTSAHECRDEPRRRDHVECEPTRVAESFRVEVCKSDDRCTDSAKLMAGTMPDRIAKCVADFVARLRAGISESGRDVGGAATAHDVWRIVCEWRNAIYRLYLENPLGVRCTAIADIAAIPIREPYSGESADSYISDATPSFLRIYEYLFLYFLDCICMSFLPACPTDPADERVLLACVTLRGDRIEHICNLSCRRFAGSFESWRYWLPIGAILSPYLQEVCCELAPFGIFGRQTDEQKDEQKDEPTEGAAEPGPTVPEVAPPPAQPAPAAPAGAQPAPVAAAPAALMQAGTMSSRSLLRAFSDDLFRLPDQFARAEKLAASAPVRVFEQGFGTVFPSLASLRSLGGKRGFALSSLAGRSATDAKADLEKRGYSVDRRPLGKADVETQLRAFGSDSMIEEGEHVVLFHDDRDRVVAWDTIDLRTDLGNTRREIAELKAEIAELKEQMGGGKPPATKKRRAR
jgi:hypothetical protein